MCVQPLTAAKFSRFFVAVNRPLTIISPSLSLQVYPTSLLEGAPPPAGVTLAALHGFVKGFRIAALVLVLFNTAAIIPSFLRRPRRYDDQVGGRTVATQNGDSAGAA